MASSTAKGNYYKRRTKEWLEARGYTVQLTEFVTSRPIGGGKMIFMKKDVFGSDGIAMNGEEIIFWNSKATTPERDQGVNKHKSAGKIEFAKYPFPSSVKRHLYIWEPRKEPVVVDCQ
jgi:hypothetical protein